MAWVLLKQNQERVLQRLKRGDYDSVALSTIGRLDELVYLMVELKFFLHLGLIELNRQREGIPDDLMLNLLGIMPIFGVPNINQVPGTLLKDAGVLRLIGCTAQQIREGFNQRGKANKQLPFHQDDLRNLLKRVKVESLPAWRKAAIGELFHHKQVKGRVYAIDGTTVLVPYGRPPEGTGEIWHNPEQADSRERADEVGFKIVFMLNVTPGHELVVTWRVLPVQASELSVVRAMVEEVLEVGGPQAIELLIMDALYADGGRLSWLKFEKDIDAIVRVDENMDIRQDMLGLARLEPGCWEEHTEVRQIQGHKEKRTVGVAAFEELASWESYDGPLYGFLEREKGASDEETMAVVCTRPLTGAWAGYQQWRRRWAIENQGARELKEGWGLEAELWGNGLGAVHLSIAMKVLGYNYVRVYHTRQGTRLIARGIRAMRRELYPGPEVIIYASDEFAVLHIEDLMALLGRPACESMRPDPLTRHKPRDAPG